MNLDSPKEQVNEGPLNVTISAKDYNPVRTELNFRFQKVHDLEDINERTIESLKNAIAGRPFRRKSRAVK